MVDVVIMMGTYFSLVDDTGHNNLLFYNITDGLMVENTDTVYTVYLSELQRDSSTTCYYFPVS